MRCYKFRWVLSQGDDHDHPEWGDSWWYYEFRPDGLVSRQVTVYDCGIRVRYGQDHMADEYGELLSDVRLGEVNLSMGQEIEAADFQSVWQMGPWTNDAAE
jgi:hypothetical protein